jgi:outer membrane lipoprotein-sorting protein
MRRWWQVLGLVVVVLVPRTAAADRGEPLAAVREVLAQCQAAYHRLVDYRGTLRHEVGEGGALLRQDHIEATFRKPAFLSLRWQTGIFKGTTLLSRPAWNRGNLLIQLGEWFEYLTLSIPPTEVGDPFVPGLKDVNEWLTALTALAQRPASDRSMRQVELRTADPSLAEGQVLLLVPAFLIPFRDNTVSIYEFVIERGTGVPLELVLRGASGEVRQRMVYTDLQVNVGVPTQAFEWEDSVQGFRPLPRAEADIDLRGFIQNWQQRYSEIRDYAGIWIAEEWTGEGTSRRQVTFKFRKPFEVYLAWSTDGGGTREALFRHGWNEGRVRVRTALLGIPLIGDLEPDGYLARRWYSSPITEFGLNRLVERLQEQLLREWLRGELTVQFRGVQDYAERPCYVIEFQVPPSWGQERSAARIVMSWDVVQRVPLQYEAFDGADRLLERHAFRHLRLNVSLSDIDFTAANPAYGFLLFRHAPRLDRFLTGRE